MFRFSAEPNHARRHSKRASFPGGKTARFPLPALDEGDRTRTRRLLCVPGLPDQVTSDDAVDDAEHPGQSGPDWSRGETAAETGDSIPTRDGFAQGLLAFGKSPHRSRLRCLIGRSGNT